ncbi:oxidoreductase [Echinicola strongylocentroti]|uniref:Oxidoreductase n=1 Tax=Echinicola strongylocentroti TaxID=1795355 RepID=A0A2Z4IL92_9BACT|nr:SDR family NAD(P)-dependent oxidoreductase [Echinicola strongylocentroti]AWW31499.1 oxidoreductase [Echinicola strongylocentroti]
MKLHDNTILITGGSSGIGLELASRLSKNNNILICGRSKEKLAAAKQKIPLIQVFSCNLAIDADRQSLFEWVRDHHPDCNVLINNAALVHRTGFGSDPAMIQKSILEIQTNLVAPIVLSKLFLPILEQHQDPAIINVTSGLVYAPKSAYPIYNATKAALHSFTQTIRMQLDDSPVAIKEVLLPVVDTPWHEGNVPKMAISPEEAVSKMLRGLEKGKGEIRVGKVKLLHLISRIAPSLASKIINPGLCNR